MSNLPGVYLHFSILEHVAITKASVRYLESVVTNVTRILSVFLTSYARLSTPGARNVRRHLCCLLNVLSWWALIGSHWFRITYLPKVESMSPYNYGYRGTGIHDRTTPTRLRSGIYLFIHILGPDRWWTNRKVLCLCTSYRYYFNEPRGCGHIFLAHICINTVLVGAPVALVTTTLEWFKVSCSHISIACDRSWSSNLFYLIIVVVVVFRDR